MSQEEEDLDAVRRRVDETLKQVAEREAFLKRRREENDAYMKARHDRRPSLLDRLLGHKPPFHIWELEGIGGQEYQGHYMNALEAKCKVCGHVERYLQRPPED